MKRSRKAMIIAGVASLAAILCWLAFGLPSDAPALKEVGDTIRSIDSASQLRLATEMIIAPRPQSGVDRFKSSVKDLFSDGPKGGIGFPSGGIQYEFQTSSDLITCRVYYEDYRVEQIELEGTADSHSAMEEIRDCLTAAHHDLRVALIEHP